MALHVRVVFCRQLPGDLLQCCVKRLILLAFAGGRCRD
jgi:hypothetical protein